MKAIRNTLFAAGLAFGALPGLSAAAQPPPPASQSQDMLRRLEELRAQLEAARARLEKSTTEVATLSRQMGRNAYSDTGMEVPPPRSLLGVELDTSAPKDGAHVRRVSPGGAAAEAGIKAGDNITSIAGLDLTKELDPARALVEKMQQAEPNVMLQVGVLRDGKKVTFEVTPRSPPPPLPPSATAAKYAEILAAAQAQRAAQLREQLNLPDRPGGSGARGIDLPLPPGATRIDFHNVLEGTDDGTRFRDMEFATLSEKLGSYFGVKSGVLVVRAGGNAAFKLQDGDVILAIDGREPTSAQHAGRILRSYGNGEQLKLRVQRDRKAQDIEITMPNVAGEIRSQGYMIVPPREPREPRPPRN